MTDEVTQGSDPDRPPLGGRHRRTLIMAAVVLVFLAVVVIVGVIRGKPDPTAKATDPPSTATTTSVSSGPPLALTSMTCAKLADGRLTVGFGVVNRGTSPLIVNELQPTFPLGGLAPDAAGVPDASSCATPPVGVPYIVSPGSEALLAFVLTPTDPRCIAPLPVDVTVSYAVDGGAAYSDSLHAFPDLGGFDLPSECSSG